MHTSVADLVKWLSLLQETVAIGPEHRLTLRVRAAQPMELRKYSACDVVDMLSASGVHAAAAKRILSATLAQMHDGKATYVHLLSGITRRLADTTCQLSLSTADELRFKRHRAALLRNIPPVKAMCIEAAACAIDETGVAATAEGVCSGVVCGRVAPALASELLQLMASWCAAIGPAGIDRVLAAPSTYFTTALSMASSVLPPNQVVVKWKRPTRFDLRNVGNFVVLLASFKMLDGLADLDNSDTSESGDSTSSSSSRDEGSGALILEEREAERSTTERTLAAAQRVASLCRDHGISYVWTPSCLPPCFTSKTLGVAFIHVDEDSFADVSHSCSVLPACFSYTGFDEGLFSGATITLTSLCSHDRFFAVATMMGECSSRTHSAVFRVGDESGLMESSCRRIAVNALRCMQSTSKLIPGGCFWLSLGEALLRVRASRQASAAQRVLLDAVCEALFELGSRMQRLQGHEEEQRTEGWWISDCTATSVLCHTLDTLLSLLRIDDYVFVAQRSR